MSSSRDKGLHPKVLLPTSTVSAQHPSPWGAPELPNTRTGLGALGLHCLSSAGRTVESLPRLD